MKLIIRLLQERICEKELYQALKKHGHKDRTKNGGLGHVFVEDHFLVTEALMINHTNQTVKLKDAEKLLELANAYRAQEKADIRQGINQNLNKYTICLAMLVSLSDQSKAGMVLKHQALSALKAFFSGNDLFKQQTFFGTSMKDFVNKKLLMLESLYDFLAPTQQSKNLAAFPSPNNS